MKVIIPLCGDSSRFPNMRPKWMLTHPNGKLMIELAISGIPSWTSKDLYFAIRQDHEEQYSASSILKKCFGNDINILILKDKTSSQVQTIYNMLTFFNIDNVNILIRDGDSYINIDSMPCTNNYILSMRNYSIDVSKSYIVRNNNSNVVKEVIEKKQVSNEFSVGGYAFRNSKVFLDNCNNCNYVSEVITNAIANGEEFIAIPVNDYKDWGTVNEWTAELEKYKVWFIDLDGVIFYNASKYFKPYWEDSKPIVDNVNYFLSMPIETQFIFATARPEEYRELTESQLKAVGFKNFQLVMGLNHAKRFIINDYSSTITYPSCEAINIPRNSVIEPRRTLVVARYQEDVDWINKVEPVVKKVVVQKGVDLEVFGREAASFIWYILQNYDSLSGYYYFVQGSPFDHAPNILSGINSKPVSDYVEFGEIEVEDDKYGVPHHVGLPYIEIFEYLFQKPCPERFSFKKGGGQFCVSAKNIKQHSKDFYERAFEMLKVHEKAPWVFERLWRSVFSTKQQ